MFYIKYNVFYCYTRTSLVYEQLILPTENRVNSHTVFIDPTTLI